MLTKAKDVYKDIDAGVWTVYVDVSCEVLVAVLTLLCFVFRMYICS
jgi:hypothetical protein